MLRASQIMARLTNLQMYILSYSITFTTREQYRHYDVVGKAYDEVHTVDEDIVFVDENRMIKTIEYLQSLTKQYNNSTLTLECEEQ